MGVQLHMRAKNLENLPPFVLPKGISLHNYDEADTKGWEDLIEDAFGERYSFEKVIVNGGDYKPEYVLNLKKDGRILATTTACEKETFPGEGWFRMVAVSSDARGLGLGRVIGLAALHSLAARGYKTAVLSTDDARLPAIKLYYNLGFRPLFIDESHEERWKKVMEQLGIENYEFEEEIR